MTKAVHPSDTLQATVVWENAANQPVPETGPTTWAAENLDGTPFTNLTITAGATDDDVTVTFTDPAETASFILVPTMTPSTGAPLKAKSEEIDVAPDNTPTQGVVTVTVA